ncbi:uncharacterized protein LOC143822787 [Paroedura picta]|uniref:uncharacterized protein LOC143822787 n=1 Tax=Paroedura picta TaxID=143630 RepID=UPI0040565362
MGHVGLYILVLMSLLVVAFERNRDDVSPCWAKGRELTLAPDQCPVEFQGADPKFCCRLCYGANCCLPKRPRVNQDRCPPAARLVGTTRVGRAVPRTEIPHVMSKPFGWFTTEILVAFVMVTFVLTVFMICNLDCRKCWRKHFRFCYNTEARLEMEAEDEIEAAVVRSSSPRASDSCPEACCLPTTPYVEDPPPYSVVDPYPEQPAADPQGTHDGVPPYPAGPVVVFQRSHSQLQDDKVVIIPGSVTSPEAAASGGEEGAAVTGSAPEQVVPLKVAASGDAPEQVIPLKVAGSSGAPEQVIPLKVAASGDAPEQVIPLKVAASGGAPEQVCPWEAVPYSSAMDKVCLFEVAASGSE